MLEIVGAAVLIAFGMLAIYFSLEAGSKDREMAAILLVGIVAIIAGGWIILTRITLATILIKFGGLILLLCGIFLVFGFPDSTDYQKGGMTSAGIFIGLVLLIVGGWLLFFA